MNVFGIGQNVSVDQIAAIQRQQQNNTQTPSSQFQGDRVSISQEARGMLAAMQSTPSQGIETPSLPSLTHDMTMPASLDNWVVTDDVIANSSMTGYIPSSFFDLGLGIKLEPVGTSGAATSMYEDGSKISAAWDSYLQAMDEFGLDATHQYAQSADFRQFRQENQEIMQQIDGRFRELFSVNG